MYRLSLVFLILLLGIASCKKWEDNPGNDDPRLNRPYCDDPEAVNYNWNFPGKPDSTTCYFPTGIFNGTYRFTDSIYSELFEYDTFFTYDISLIAQSKSRFFLNGFCNGTLKFTADRFYRASADSLMLPDSTFLKGQIACRPVDTLNGTIIKDPQNDKILRISFTVYSDTGINLHIGSAIKQ